VGMNATCTGLSAAEERSLQALLWEEGHLVRGPATRMAADHGLVLLRCLAPAIGAGAGPAETAASGRPRHGE